MESGSDGELVGAARAGDTAALAGLYDRYADRVLGLAYSVLRNRDEAADVVQDSFLKAASRLDQLRDPERFRPWLFSIARHEALARGRERGRTVVTDDVPLGEDGDAPTGPAPDAAALVWEAAEGLSPEDRAVLDLHVRDELVGEDLAEAMGVTPAQAYNRLHRVRGHLERSVGALLVTTAPGHHCEGLEAATEDWTGSLTPRWRKRIARHVDRCDRCTNVRTEGAAPFAAWAAVPLLAAGPALRDPTVESMARAVGSGAVDPSADASPGAPGTDSPDGPSGSGQAGGPPPGSPPDPAGMPTDPSPGSRVPRPVLIGVLVAVVLAAAVALMLLLGGDDDSTDRVALDAAEDLGAESFNEDAPGPTDSTNPADPAEDPSPTRTGSAPGQPLPGTGNAPDAPSPTNPTPQPEPDVAAAVISAPTTDPAVFYEAGLISLQCQGGTLPVETQLSVVITDASPVTGTALLSRPDLEDRYELPLTPAGPAFVVTLGPFGSSGPLDVKIEAVDSAGNVATDVIALDVTPCPPE